MIKKLLLSIGLITLVLAGNAQPVNFIWAQSMGGKGTFEGSVGMTRDAAGNIYITGEFSGTRQFGSYTLTALGYTDVFVCKYNATGTCQWAVRGGAMFSTAYAGKIAVSGNDLYVTGNFTSIIDFNGQAISSSGGKDIFISGFDQATGNCLWIDKAGSPTFDDISYGIAPASGGGFYICGTFTGTATFGSYQVSSSSIVDNDIFLARYTATGTCTWITPIGSTGIDIAYALKVSPSGTILVTGQYEGTVNFGPGYVKTSVGFSDFFLASFQPVGTLNWVFSGGGDNNDIGLSVSTDAIGNIVTTGFIADTSSFGNINVNNGQGMQVCTIRFNPFGSPQWVRTGGCLSDDQGFDVIVDAGGSAYVTGYVSGNSMFGSTALNGVTGNDGFVLKYDPTGTLRWITKIGGLNMDRGKTLIEESNGYVFAAGDFADNAAFGSTGLYTDPGVTGIYLTRIGGGTVGVNELEKMPFRVYPNPATDFVYLDLENIKDDAFTLSIYTTDGREVTSTLLSQNDARPGFRYDISGLAQGNYFLRLETSQGEFNVSIFAGK